jgi:hypothetical protein
VEESETIIVPLCPAIQHDDILYLHQSDELMAPTVASSVSRLPGWQCRPVGTLQVGINA